MCLSLQLKVVHFKIQCRKVNVVCIVVTEIASVLETLFCLMGSGWELPAEQITSIFINTQVLESIDFYFFIYLKFLVALMLILNIWFSWNPVCSLHIYWLFAYIRQHAIQSVLPLSVEVQVWSSQYRTSSVGVRRTVLCIILDCSFKEHCTVSTSEWQIDELQQYLFVNVPHNANAILVWILCWNTVLIS